MLIDTHCHLDAPEFDADREAVLASARAGGVGAIVVPGVFRREWDDAQALADRHEDVYFALGIHPLYVDGSPDEDLAALRERILAVRDHPRLVGLGEIGLDFFVPGLDLVRQQRFFEAQLALAREFALPVILHTRRSVDAVTKQLRRYRPPSGIAHAFTGSPQQAEHLIRLEMALGFGGTMTFGRARNIRRLAESLPADSLVLETDAPDMSPAWVHPGRNQPAELPRIATVLAELRNQSLDDIVAATARNARRVLPALQRHQSGS